MIKHIALALAAGLTLSQASAQGFRFKKMEEKIYSLHVGQVSMDIDANNGARIVSLRYDSTEVLSHINAPNMYGSTFWTSPQKEWNWPPVMEHDMLPYQVAEQEGVITMTSQLSAKLPFIITKTFRADTDDNCIVVTYGVKNESEETRLVAPWEITRVLSRGSICFDADVEQITPAGLMPFVNREGKAWYDIDHVEGVNRKINADGKGWLAYLYDGLMLIKQFPDLTPDQPAPGEAEIQVYVHQGNAYVELESQGAYTTLQPHESFEWTVRWYLRPGTEADMLNIAPAGVN